MSLQKSEPGSLNVFFGLRVLVVFFRALPLPPQFSQLASGAFFFFSQSPVFPSWFDFFLISPVRRIPIESPKTSTEFLSLPECSLPVDNQDITEKRPSFKILLWTFLFAPPVKRRIVPLSIHNTGFLAISSSVLPPIGPLVPPPLLGSPLWLYRHFPPPICLPGILLFRTFFQGLR